MLQEYLLPTTVDSALIMLKDHGGRARLIAGGTDLILQEEKAEKKAQILVDISRIQDLQKIEKKGDALFIGACVTHTEIATSPLVKKHAPALAFSCSCVGGKQIRNIATSRKSSDSIICGCC
ncbi:FAD binding domain-containing protein [Desulfovibrio litoralis]|uniref:Molybdopterin dehydrogenase FAD binding domain-containing protein n=1 Tax=Desulfovibrio litoralis DSM 11393 TaxID=1121455 RepID=A0A1M7TJA7_9BACT|nr:FAD binding domain-containing protein [Desulfovibrio litoralis]SHN70723.1 molybdopterin dehydrogenase FAD binding domain-containing protein [Desulfovibrio litoralis DSM 11393]